MSDATQPLWDQVLGTYDARRRERSDIEWQPFQIVQRGPGTAYLGETETLLALTNGYVGVRGALEEDQPSYERATLVNGFHETWPIVYGEDAHGFAQNGQTIVPVPDGTRMRLYVDDEPFQMDTATIRHSERILDMEHGVLRRNVQWETPDGRALSLRTRRFVSLEHRHLVVFDYEVEMLDASATLTIASDLVTPEPRDNGSRPDPRRSHTQSSVLQPLSHMAEGDRAVLTMGTQSSAMRLGCGVHHVMDASPGLDRRTEADEVRAQTIVIVDARAGTPVRIQKFVAYHVSGLTDADELEFRVNRTLDRALHVGMDELNTLQTARMRRFWDIADVCIDGAPEAQSTVRYNLFQLCQASERADGKGLPAKGLTGTGYEGQYFWDVDIYVLPFLAYTNPQLARNYVGFRASMLDKARDRAREVGHRGALYPWRTINGEEASAHYAAGTAQYHINADVVWAMRKYSRVTGDLDVMADPGFETLIETARFWVDLGFFSDRMNGEFVINGVTGPDEYTTVVDNNLYTNLMARENLLAAADTAEWLQTRHPADYRRAVQRTALEAREVDVWRRAGERMHVPFDDTERLYLQDDGFLNREVWDFAGTAEDCYPLLLHFHPLEIYRHQVIKQADVVLATFLLGHWFTSEEKRRIFEYYDPLTTGDSSLSAPVQSVMATELGLMRNAVEYFAATLFVDLLDLGANVRDGIHLAAAGGVWLSLVQGFGGLRDSDGELRFQPAIPSGWQRLTFRLRHLSQVIEVCVSHDHVTYQLLEGSHAVVHHWDEEVHLGPNALETRRNPRREELPKLTKLSERPLHQFGAEPHDTIEVEAVAPAVPFS